MSEKQPEWKIGDRFISLKYISQDEYVPEGIAGKLIEIDRDEEDCTYFIKWDNGALTGHYYPDNEIAKTKIITVTDSAPVGGLDKWIATFLNDGWTIAFEAINTVIVDGETQTIHTARLQREEPIIPDDITPTPPTSPIDNLRQQTEVLIDDEDSDNDPEPPAPTPEPEHNPTLFLTAPDPVQAHIDAVNTKIDCFLVKSYQEIAKKYAGWTPTPFGMVAV